MTLTEYRDSRGLSLSECALALGLQSGSKGHLSRLENGLAPWPIKLALQVEAWSGGEVRAVDLVSPDDAALLSAAIARGRALTAVAA